ncbi:hypothetical protein AJ78_04008 [Emergomyces pasteurianus Ep9510]|uniref:Uncharacterized protein n=1 Tax=Emergomyces pasteurianus Ep9510 TaxID=1447872 RepID=A0A1J9QHX3_9EURO|nr:hypothetical protein AJ78_04008 [Emergomyces pasteurianus Ep9510]
MPRSTAETQNDPSSPFPRSASYNHLSVLDSNVTQSDVKRTFSETNLPQSSERQAQLDQDSFQTGKQVLRQASIRLSNGRPKAKEVSTSFSNGNIQGQTKSSATQNGTERTLATGRPSKSRSVSSTIATLARKPWMSSRSPSPSPPKETKVKASKPSGVASADTTGNGTSDNDSQNKSTDTYAHQPSKTEKSQRNSVLIKGNRKSGNFRPNAKNEVPPNSQKRPFPSLRARVSLDRLSGSPSGSNEDVPPVPQIRTRQLPQLKVDPPRKKDELWSAFRGIDADYQKFHSKSSSLKANVLRSTLLPFLSRYANHSSGQFLRPEDLDRRINILNKWWTGLLEVLNGRTSQSLSGIDRPVFLEAIVGIMTRPEWRIPILHDSPSPSTPTAPNIPTPISTSNTSLESTGTDFLIESIHHNIRNIFAQNLLSQIGYCIDKLSMRQTPASLVTFAGKTCAYAFFFCPGVADMLVRLWNPTPDTLRRVLGGFNVDRSTNARIETSDYVSSYFPSTLQSLCFRSHASIVRCLRQKRAPPLGTTNVNWSGPWVSRWSGRDTDLFFVFAKHFHILVAQILPSGFERSKYIFVPGLLSVHAQILTVMEHTLNKQSTASSMDNIQTTVSTTFEDFIDGTDASASAIPLGTANSLRVMSENRLILLLRDIVTDRSVDLSIKQMFMENFCAILMVATKKISRFDHNACFVLFDFVEELVSIIPPYCESTHQPDLLNWDFWLDVCRQMMESNNALTEVRAFSFIYATWNEITRIDEGKEALCLGIILNETYFYRYFNHWSPMVRAYFHRLLCWRLARYEGKLSTLDLRIYNTLLDRLGSIWNYFLFCQAKAEREFTAPLSTAPCSPAPGRRILIIRNDYQPTSSFFVCLDNIIPTPSSGQLSTYTGHGSLPDIEPNKSRSESPPPSSKKRWKSLKTIFISSSNLKPGEVTPTKSSYDEAELNVHNDTNPAEGLSEHEIQQASTKNQPKYTFRFSLQWNDRARWPSKDRRLFPPSLPLPAQLFLQSLRTKAARHVDSADESPSISLSGTNSDDDSDSEGAEISSISNTIATAAEATASNINMPPSPKPNLTVVTFVSNQYPDGGEGYQHHHPFVASKYAGRALAEWALVVCECDNFFARRRDEGVPSDDAVETPILGVEGFRK